MRILEPNVNYTGEVKGEFYTPTKKKNRPKITGRYTLISVDVDDLWLHQREYGMKVHYNATIIRPALRQAADLFHKYQVRATFFFVGKDLVIRPEDMQEIFDLLSEQGHEVANHGYAHLPGTMMSPQKAHRDLLKAHKILSATSHRPIVGYRAPFWSPHTDTLEQLQDLGYTYDSSDFPSRAFSIFLRAVTSNAGRMLPPMAIARPTSPTLIKLSKGYVCKLPMTRVFGLPFYSTIHLYPRAGYALFYLQHVLVSQRSYCSYVFHALDFVEAPVLNLRGRLYNVPYDKKLLRIHRILAHLTNRRKSVPMAEYISHIMPQMKTANPSLESRR